VRDLNELQRLAEQGHDESQFLLGYHFTRGQQKDINKAKLWLERAAMANNPRAQYYLGELCAELGRGDPRGAYNHMAYWWGKSANHPYWETMEGMDGRAVSKRRLVWLHMHSDYENASAEEALRLLGELANKYSSPRSAIELGIVYASGSFAPLSKRLGNAPVPRDAENGFRLIERGLLIIENGNNDIDYNLYNIIADVYLSRDGTMPRTPDSLQRGIRFKQKALERATGVNEAVANNIKNELATLEAEHGRSLGIAPSPSASSQATTSATTQPAPARSSEMNEKFARFHAYFDTLTLEGKRDFITSLDQKLQANPNPDYQGFMLECVEKYRVANKEQQGQAGLPVAESRGQGGFAPGQHVGLGHVGTGHASSGHTGSGHAGHAGSGAGVSGTGSIPPQTHRGEQPSHRGEQSLHRGEHDQFAPGGGNFADEPTPARSHSPAEQDSQGDNQSDSQGYDYQQQHIAAFGGESYTDRIHTYGASTPFLFGAVLYSLGGLLLPLSMWIFSEHPLFYDASRRMLGYGFMSVVAVLPILPIMALWMIYSASKSPRAPEKSLTSLTLFRVTFFIHLGVIMAGAAILALLFGADGQAFPGLSIFESPLHLVLILGALAIVVLYVTFFYGSLFSMVKGIRDGIYSNMFDELPGVSPFSVINYITSILLILVALAVILIGVAPVDALPIEIPFQQSFDEVSQQWFGTSATIAVSVMAFGLILSRAGALLCTNVVNQFAGGLGEYDEV